MTSGLEMIAVTVVPPHFLQCGGEEDAVFSIGRPRSEPELRRKLHHTWVERCRDRPEAGRSELRRRCAEVHGVQQIEYFQTQLDRTLTGKADSTQHGEIDIAVRRPSHGIARRGSDRERVGCW